MLRRLAAALGTPLRFSLETGHLRSSILRRSVDAGGRPIPWYTYPAIAFLEGLRLGDCRVLEYGGGQSTLWWGGRARSVVTVEEDPGWFRRVQERARGRANVRVVLCTDPEAFPAVPRGQTYDIVVVDGGPRLACAHEALSLVDSRGLVILDNSEGFWGGDQDGTHPIIDLYNRHGWHRADFHGYAPGVFRPHCTSVFFRPECRLMAGLPPPRRPAPFLALSPLVTRSRP